jgi:hypothetical protein
MKRCLLILCAAVAFGCAAHGGIIYSSIANSGYIPDSSAVGLSDTATASGYLPTISQVSVNLNISGGYNGDLYAYLSYGGVLVPLLNRVGVTATGGGKAFGYGDTGFNITLSSSALNDVHFYGNSSPSLNGNGQLTGSWQPDGRAIDPLSAPGSFDSGSRVGFSSYNTLNPNGTWTLFIADLSAGGQSQLVNWELDITAVPEPVNFALGIFAAVFLAVTLVRSQPVRRFARRAVAG